MMRSAFTIRRGFRADLRVHAAQRFRVGALGTFAIAAGKADVAERAPLGGAGGFDLVEVGELIGLGIFVVAGVGRDFGGEAQHFGRGFNQERREELVRFDVTSVVSNTRGERRGAVEIGRADHVELTPDALGFLIISERFLRAAHAFEDRFVLRESGCERLREVARLGGLVVVEPH